jgi:hypothetical protein
LTVQGRISIILGKTDIFYSEPVGR